MRWKVLAIIALILPTTANSTDHTPRGVWKGMLGNAAIVACFNDRGGNYYYKRYLIPISLNQARRKYQYDELLPDQEKSNQWKLDASQENKLQGTWVSADGKRKLPIKLTLVDGHEDPRACARSSYTGPLDAAVTMISGKRKLFGTHAYRTLTFANSQTLQILDGTPSAAIINRKLLKHLDKSPKAVTKYIDYRRHLLGTYGVAGDELYTYPVYWTSHWLMIRFYRWTAGMGRSGIGWHSRTFDYTTGKQVDPWDWFDGSSKGGQHDETGGRAPMPEKLRKVFFRGNVGAKKPAANGTDCKDYYSPDALYDLTLANDGFHFDERAYGDGCALNFVLPYAKALPILTPAGKRMVRGILAAHETSPRDFP